MEIPIELLLSYKGNKYELSVAMMKYVEKLEEIPELLQDVPDKEKEKKAALAIYKILSKEVKYHYNIK